MLNGKDMIIRLIVGLIKKHWMNFSCIKMSQTFLSHLKVLGELLMLKLIFQINTCWYFKFCTKNKFS